MKLTSKYFIPSFKFPVTITLLLTIVYGLNYLALFINFILLFVLFGVQWQEFEKKGHSE